LILSTHRAGPVEEYSVCWSGSAWRDDRIVVQPKPRISLSRQDRDPTRKLAWEAQLCHALEAGPHTIRQLMAAFGVAHAAVYVPLERLHGQGRIVIVGWVTDTRGRPAKQYGLPESSR